MFVFFFVFDFVSGSKGIAGFPDLKAFFVFFHEMGGFQDELPVPLRINRGKAG